LTVSNHRGTSLLVEDLPLVGKDFLLIGKDRVEFRLVLQNVLLVGENVPLVDEEFFKARLVRQDFQLIGEDFFLVRDDLVRHGCGSFARRIDPPPFVIRRRMTRLPRVAREMKQLQNRRPQL
jgi:hypothetical protein